MMDFFRQFWCSARRGRHAWTKWIDKGMVRLSEYCPEMEERPRTIGHAEVQRRHCAACDLKQSRRVTL